MKKIVGKILCVMLMLLLIGGVSFFGVGYVNYKNAIEKEPIVEKIKHLQSKENYVAYADISKDLLTATVSIEDHRFYDHNGVDYYAMMRAFVSNLFAQGIVGGGSTITQQLAKNLYFTNQPSYIRKMSEVFMAYDLEDEFSKQEILELYVNVINYGDNHMGIYNASYGYFNKHPKDLTLNEASMMAGLPQSPSNYQLSDHLESAKVRQKQVLEAMIRDGKITKSAMLEITQ